VIGQRPDERALFEGVIASGLVDVGRALHPQRGDLFTWWPFWQGARLRNVGWRLDYVLASAGLATGAASARIEKEIGTSDHAPVVVEFESASGPAQMTR
jgi:exodeoxyribonuclease-3